MYVDTTQKNYFFCLIDELIGNRTTMVIAHKLLIIKNVDEIVMVDQGRVIGQRAPERLLRKKENFIDTSNRSFISDRRLP